MSGEYDHSKPKKYMQNKMQFEKSCKLLFYLSGGMLLILKHQLKIEMDTS